tara:strand:- start:218 stop:1390 length:1173 start_codon:yes stop_codon:yes gene_type:complete
MKFLLKTLDMFFGKLLSLLIIYLSRKFNIKYTSRNLWGSLGHTLVEMDYFLRLKKLGQIDNSIKIVFLSNEKKMSKIIYQMFKKNFIFLITLPYIEIFLKRRVLWPNQDLCLDIGLNSLGIDSDSSNFSHEDLLNRYSNYYKMILKTENYKPFKNFKIDKKLIEFLGFDLDKENYIVMQVKQNTANATALKTDPSTYIKTIEYFQRNNFKIIFAGSKEAFPKEFENKNIINYNKFIHQSIKTDINLISKASFVISCASGFGLLPFTQDVPCIFINTWIVAFPVPGKYIVHLPVKLKDKTNNKLISFHNMIKHYLEVDNYDFNSHHLYEVVPNNDEEILEAALEAISLKKNYYDFSDNYKNFIKKYDDLPIRYASSRISEKFILKNINLFK